MPRQKIYPSALNNIPKDENGNYLPVETLSILQTPKQAKESRARRERKWERNNRAKTYRVPAALNLKAKDIQASLVSIASEYLTTTSSMAAAFMDYALTHLRAGKFQIDAQPKPERRTLTIEWKEIEESGWPREIKACRPKKANALMREERIFFGYRWSEDLNRQVQAIIKQTGISGGEVVAYLLSYSISAYRAGKLIPEITSVTISNKVSTWGSGK